MTKKLFIEAITKFILGVVLVGLLIFFPAGTVSRSARKRLESGCALFGAARNCPQKTSIPVMGTVLCDRSAEICGILFRSHTKPSPYSKPSPLQNHPQGIIVIGDSSCREQQEK